MPCNSEYLEATNLEIEISRVACLLDEIKGKKKFDKNHWNGYHPEVYGKITRSLADEYTAKRCSILRKKEVTKYSLEMQIWWRDHQKADKARLRKEKLEIKKELRRAERNLKETQEKLEQLQEQPPILIK